jgi:hypothetical protein
MMAALFQVFTVGREQLQVVWMVVLLIAVSVMDNLAWFQKSADGLFHDKNVFSHVTVVVGPRVLWSYHEAITLFHNERISFKCCVATSRTPLRGADSFRARDETGSALDASRTASRPWRTWWCLKTTTFAPSTHFVEIAFVVSPVRSLGRYTRRGTMALLVFVSPLLLTSASALRIVLLPLACLAVDAFATLTSPAVSIARFVMEVFERLHGAAQFARLHAVAILAFWASGMRTEWI